MRIVVLSTWAVVMALMVLPSVAPAQEMVGEIVIEAHALHPEVLMTEPERRVLFTNRSGQHVHIQFMMRNGGQHDLIQVPEQIWAVFHQVGRHPFEVHFGDPAMANLHGAVEVVGSPYGGPDPLTCSGITVMGACLER